MPTAIAVNIKKGIKISQANRVYTELKKGDKITNTKLYIRVIVDEILKTA